MRIVVVSLLFLFLNIEQSHADGSLSEDLLFKSKSLNYSLNYRVYLPSVADEKAQFPALYIVDGELFTKNDRLIKIIDNEINKGTITPIAVIFIDSRTPGDLSKSRRNQEFMCNPKYLEFFVSELVPTIEKKISSGAK